MHPRVKTPRLCLLVLAFAAMVAAVFWLHPEEKARPSIPSASAPMAVAPLVAADVPAGATDSLAAFDAWLAEHERRALAGVAR